MLTQHTCFVQVRKIKVSGFDAARTKVLQKTVLFTCLIQKHKGRLSGDWVLYEVVEDPKA